ncbi:MAG TPA: thioesterase [Bacteroidales bacterium]|nr:thioesterase [Bacteroidales bacterium]
MITSKTTVRVRYGETDKMGFVYYGNYALYLEVGRAEAMRQLGLSYREMEEMGIIMPISQMQIKYITPARYDDLLTVTTMVHQLPTARMVFDYEIHKHENILLCKASTTLAFINHKTVRPVAAPQWFLDKITPFFHTL